MVKMECHYTGAWEEMATIYRKQELSEEEIAERGLCKTTKAIEKKKGLGGCDK